MAISRVSGNLLQDNLERGSNLSIQTDLVYVDIFNDRVGINTASTTHTLTVNGNSNISGNLYAGNVITGIVDANSAAVSGNLSSNNISAAETVSANNATISETVSSNNVSVGNTVFSTSVETDLVDVSQLITVGNATSGLQLGQSELFGEEFGAIWPAGANRDSSSFSLATSNNYNGNMTTVLGGRQVYVVDSGQSILMTIDTDNSNVSVNGNVLVSNGNVSLGTGYITDLADPVLAQDAATKFYVDNISGNITASLGNFTFSNTTISSSISPANITIAPTGNGLVILDCETGLVLPSGNSSQRPAPATEGTLRYNTETGKVEVYDSDSWEEVGITITNQTITPDGSSTIYTLDRNSTTAAALISINGVVQLPTVAYTVSGNLVTFAEAPLSTDIIDIRFL